MAFTCGFFDSKNHDRKYNAEQLSAIFDGIIKDGVFDSIGKIFSVTPNIQVPGRLAVTVDTGRAWFDHTWNDNSAPMPLQIEPADISLKRYDAVILEVDHTDPIRNSSIKIKKGLPASNPQKPAMIRSKARNQYPFAYITIRPGASSITSSDIEIMVGRNECPFVTGILDSVDISDLFNQWQGDFDTWFQNIKDQLSGDVAANLQRQIDERVKIADKANSVQAIDKNDDTHWMTPKSVSEAVEANAFSIGDIRSSGRNLEALYDGKYLACDGRIVERSVYPKLVEAISDRYGLGHTIKQLGFIADVQYGYGVPACVISPDGRTLAIAHDGLKSESAPDVVMLFSLDTNTVTKSIVMPSHHYFIPIAYDGDKVYGYGRDKSVEKSKHEIMIVDTTNGVAGSSGSLEFRIQGLTGVSFYNGVFRFGAYNDTSDWSRQSLYIIKMQNGLPVVTKVSRAEAKDDYGFIFGSKAYAVFYNTGGGYGEANNYVYKPQEMNIDGGALSNVSNPNVLKFINFAYKNSGDPATAPDIANIVYSANGEYAACCRDNVVMTINTKFEIKEYSIVYEIDPDFGKPYSKAVQISNAGKVMLYVTRPSVGDGRYCCDLFSGLSVGNFIRVTEVVQRHAGGRYDDINVTVGNGRSVPYGITAYLREDNTRTPSGSFWYYDEYLMLHRYRSDTSKLPDGPYPKTGPTASYIRAK